MIFAAGAGVASQRRPPGLRSSAPPILAALLCLAGYAPGAYAQGFTAVEPCREEDDPPATFEYRGVQVTISESCWKSRVGNSCQEVVKGWSTTRVSAEAKKAIDRLKDDACLGPGVREAAAKRTQSLQVLCKPSFDWCGLAVLNSQTITLGTFVGDKQKCLGTTMTHEMLHAHAGLPHEARCAVDVTFSCEQSCFKRNSCQECTGGLCSPNRDAVNADLCKSR